MDARAFEILTNELNTHKPVRNIYKRAWNTCKSVRNIFERTWNICKQIKIFTFEIHEGLNLCLGIHEWLITKGWLCYFKMNVSEFARSRRYQKTAVFQKLTIPIESLMKTGSRKIWKAKRSRFGYNGLIYFRNHGICRFKGNCARKYPPHKKKLFDLKDDEIKSVGGCLDFWVRVLDFCLIAGNWNRPLGTSWAFLFFF